jgi:hypothetical protein
MFRERAPGREIESRAKRRLCFGIRGGRFRIVALMSAPFLKQKCNAKSRKTALN